MTTVWSFGAYKCVVSNPEEDCSSGTCCSYCNCVTQQTNGLFHVLIISQQFKKKKDHAKLVFTATGSLNAMSDLK